LKGVERKENVLAHSRAGGFPTSFCPEGVMADMSWRRIVRFWKSCGQFGDQASEGAFLSGMVGGLPSVIRNEAENGFLST
jgi:hypothetical protein